MSLPERRERQAALLKTITDYDVHAWREDFLRVLDETSAEPPIAQAA